MNAVARAHKKTIKNAPRLPLGVPNLKQLKTIEALPRCGFNMAKAMREGGYTEHTSRAGATYASLRKTMDKLGFFSKEAIERDIADTRSMAKRKGDITNLNRIDEHRARIAGIVTEKREIDNKNPTQIVIAYGDKNASKSETKPDSGACKEDTTKPQGGPL